LQDVAARVRFNPNLIRSWLGAVAGVVDNITLLAMVLTGAALIREREHGTIEHLLVMPVTPVEIMLSKIWSMGLVVLLVSSLALVGVVQGILAVPIQGSIWLFVLATALFLCAMTSLGIALATIAGSMPQFGLLLMLTLLPLLVLSGNVTPFESMPAVIKKIMLAAPNTHFVALAQSILFRGAGFDIVWPQFLALLVISAVLFVFALARFRSFLK
jgi:ABC-2 type transport system permease protein